jgi:hypothetical protein
MVDVLKLMKTKFEGSRSASGLTATGAKSTGSIAESSSIGSSCIISFNCYRGSNGLLDPYDLSMIYSYPPSADAAGGILSKGMLKRHSGQLDTIIDNRLN